MTNPTPKTTRAFHCRDLEAQQIQRVRFCLGTIRFFTVPVIYGRILKLHIHSFPLCSDCLKIWNSRLLCSYWCLQNRNKFALIGNNVGYRGHIKWMKGLAAPRKTYNGDNKFWKHSNDARISLMKPSPWLARSIYQPQRRNRAVMLGMHKKKSSFNYQNKIFESQETQ